MRGKPGQPCSLPQKRADVDRRRPAFHRAGSRHETHRGGGEEEDAALNFSGRLEDGAGESAAFALSYDDGRPSAVVPGAPLRMS